MPGVMSKAENVVVRPSATSGKGLFSNTSIDAGGLILELERPLIAIPDAIHLEDACAHCFFWAQVPTLYENGTSKRLQWCSRCKKVKYCSKVTRPSFPWLRKTH